MPIKILKQRYGFATNSSSVHSIIFFDKEHKYEDTDVEEGEYGWNVWIAASAEEKQKYLATQLKHNLYALIRTKIPEEYLDELTYSLCGARPGNYIDHQSIMALPRRHNSNLLDLDFFKELSNSLMTDKIIFAGGNDNEYSGRIHDGTDVSYPFTDKDVDDREELFPYVNTTGRRILVSKYDEEMDEWVVFNQRTGKKTRLSFTKFEEEMRDKSYPGMIDYESKYSSFPELVDLKITNYCERNCSFCYQGSGKKGKHADYRDICHLADIMSKVGVFEVAIGGGEPTKHPEFKTILSAFRKRDIIPNFSTGTLDWLDDEEMVNEVVNNVGGWAYTVRSVAEVDTFIEKIKECGKFQTSPSEYSSYYDKTVASVHLVMGTLEREEFRVILEKCAAYKITTTLLGFKQVGKGRDVGVIPYEWLFEEIKDLRDRGLKMNISVDTSIVREFSEEMKNVSSLLYDENEAARSLYIDAVEGTIAPYSYNEKAEKFPYVNGYKWEIDCSVENDDYEEKWREQCAREEAKENEHLKKSIEELIRCFQRFQMELGFRIEDEVSLSE